MADVDRSSFLQRLADDQHDAERELLQALRDLRAAQEMVLQADRDLELAQDARSEALKDEFEARQQYNDARRAFGIVL